MGWDQAILEAVAAHRAGWTTTLARGLMAAGRSIGTYVAVPVVTLGVAWRYRAWRPVGWTLGATVGALLFHLLDLLPRHVRSREHRAGQTSTTSRPSSSRTG
jgi:hypothetical protein